MSSTAFFFVAIAGIFATNLMPAFGPPTWALLVFFKFNGDLPLVPLVVGGALASASGRYLLARGSHRFREHVSPVRRRHLADAGEILTQHRTAAAGGLGLFVLSPLPSAQLFVAAGLLSVPLIPLTLAFFFGRLVSYTIYLGGATLAYESLGDTLTSSFTSPAGILVQVVLVAVVVALVELDWARWVTDPPWRPRADRSGPPVPSSGPEAPSPQNDGGRPEGRPPEPAA